MSEPPVDADDAVPSPRLEVWLAERELLAAAAVLRDERGMTVGEALATSHRVSYEAAWLRFMVALCNLPLHDRPVAVEHAIDALRDAHALRSKDVPETRPGGAPLAASPHDPHAAP